MIHTGCDWNLKSLALNLMLIDTVRFSCEYIFFGPRFETDVSVTTSSTMDKIKINYEIKLKCGGKLLLFCGSIDLRLTKTDEVKETSFI